MSAKCHPIPFNGAMVLALLDGRKTQTRRIIKRPLQNPGWTKYVYFGPSKNDPTCQSQAIECGPDYPDGNDDRVMCPYGQPGDQLWVSEAWRTDAGLDDKDPSTFSGWPVRYDADGKALRHGAFYGDPKGKTRSPESMPRWASRITLEIMSMRVERLQEISEADCRAEGAAGGHGAIPGYGYSAAPREHYRHIWESINGADSWGSSPWVWAVEFLRVERA